MAETVVKSGEKAPTKKFQKLQGEIARMGEILRILKREYPEAQCSLFFTNPFELLVATILSAQCTDEQVNKITPALFKKFPSPEVMAKAKLSEIEKLVKTTGFFRNKAHNIKEASRAIVEVHGGQVPSTLNELVALRGVGRKTANVVLGNIFDTPGLVVDTHVGRLSRRMGFTRSEDPVKVEHEMEVIVPREDWTVFSHLMISHGRAVCTARRAQCDECVIARYCPKVGV